jgi:hypothetical protein
MWTAAILVSRVSTVSQAAPATQMERSNSARRDSKIMIILAWVVVVTVAFVAGTSFWTLFRAPVHLRRLVGESAELRCILEFLGPKKLAKDAQSIKPVFGSYAKNIAVWEYTHRASLRKPKNFFLFFSIADIVGAYFVSTWCLITVGVILVLPVLFPLGSSARNYNVTHIHTILLNLIKWHDEDAVTCQRFCTSERPDLSALHSLVAGLQEHPSVPPGIGLR